MNIIYRLASLAIFLAVAETSFAVTVDMTSGATGTAHAGQSFNETRGVTATLLGSVDLNLLSHTARRIYDRSGFGRDGGCEGLCGYGYADCVCRRSSGTGS